MSTEPDGVQASRRPVEETESRRANRRGWDDYSAEYQATHGEFLGDAGFVWGPEGTDEATVGVLGEVHGRRVLEVGSGAGQCARWLRRRGAHAFGLDLAMQQLEHSRVIDDRTGTAVPSVCATATAIPFADETFDIAFSSFGALQFVADATGVVAEVGRVLRPGGRFAFSVTHPVRWAMPDDAGPEGMVISSSYWDRTPYVEEGPDGQAVYVEHHRTLGDWVHLLHRHGFVLRDLLEPEWPEGHQRIWGGWGPLRGRLVPGTAIFVSDVAARSSPGASGPTGRGR